MPVARPHALAALAALSLAASSALAQSTPLDLEAAWALAPAVAADVATRRTEVEVADRGVARTALDPLATGLERLQATQALAAAEAALQAAGRSARTAALQAYVAVAEALDALAEGDVRAGLAQRNLTAARIRHAAGAITDLALGQAVADADGAVRAARDAATQVELAWIDLGSVIGRDAGELRAAGIASVPGDPATLPNLDADLANLAANHSGIAAAERALALSRVRLGGVDHEASSPNAVADARADVASAERRLDDARRDAVQQLRAAHQSLLVAYGRLGDARLADAAAATTLSAQRVRLDVGELSPIAWTEAELDRDLAAASLRASVHAAWLQWLRYEQALAGG